MYPPGPEPMITTSNLSICDDAQTARFPELKVERQLFWLLDAFLHFDKEGDGFFSVDGAMVVAEREVHHRPHFDSAVSRDRSRHDLVHAKNSTLRRIQNRRAQE